MDIKKIMKELDLSGNALPVVGGDINLAYHIVSQDRSYFLKLHHGGGREFFQAEVRGLEELRKVVRVPEIFHVGELNGDSFLLMEWIEPGEGRSEDIGTGLAKVHQLTESNFGFSEDNYLGVLPQKNTPCTSWQSFYLNQRLLPQIEIAKVNNRWNPRRERNFQKLKNIVETDWQDMEVTSRLLHGDFWSGNVFFSQEGEPVFIDPAISYGHREMDIAMGRLFGGFRKGLFRAYESAFPLDEGWEDRLPIYQLYYLLAHLNMFGESYGSLVDQILSLY